ncbi:MAG: polysaccharide biosynthesis protein, partial [Deltaproteobacteria bacterium]|nr:polysaccharide biosynthesis protein [Deltaproteobacteria bacterium]
MKNILRNKNFYLMLLTDAVLVALAYIMAHWLRFEGSISLSDWTKIRHALPYLVPLKLACFFGFGLYRGMWRYTSLVDMRKVLMATSFASVVVVLFILYQYRFEGYSRSVYVIDLGLTFMFVGGFRVLIRILFGSQFVSSLAQKDPRGDLPLKKLLIVGAGNAGEKVLREIYETQWHRLRPAGFLDDDPGKRGKTIHGIPVLGTLDSVGKIKVEFDEILIAMPSVRGEVMRRIVSLCEETGKPFRTVPGIWELIEGKVSVNSIRKVRIEDLLDRDEVHLNEEEIREYIKDKRVLITGAGGSIGSELVRQVGHFHPQALELLDFSEEKLFKIQGE